MVLSLKPFKLGNGMTPVTERQDFQNKYVSCVSLYKPYKDSEWTRPDTESDRGEWCILSYTEDHTKLLPDDILTFPITF